MSLRSRLAALVAAALAASSLAVTVAVAPVGAALPAPIILNNGAQNSGTAQWAETQALPDDGGVRTFFSTFLVKHAVGRTIDNVRIDADFNGSDNTSSGTLVAVSDQTFVASAGGIETSRITVGINVGKPGGFGCPVFGTKVRSVDAPIRMRVVDSTTEQSATVTTTVRFIENSNCVGAGDFPRLVSASQNLTEVIPGQDITYTFSCDDVDTDFFSSDDDCDRADIRWRRLDDGTTSATTLKTGINDNTATTHVMDFPSQGHYVVEARLGNEDGGFPNIGGTPQGWWRLGNAVVNDAASSVTGSLSFSGTQPSSPPSVNPGTAVTAAASVADTGGAVQVIEWNADAHLNSSFERREYTVPTNTGGDIVHPALTGTELQQSVNTATPGLKTVGARATDNGALDAADNIRRQASFSGQIRVNALPVANTVPVSTNEDTATTITLLGSDPDSQPAPIEYSIVSGLTPAAAGSLGILTGNQVTFTPAADYFGPASFTYRVRDGNGGTVGANGFSNTATVNINVASVNDLPIVDANAASTPEDTPVDVTMTGNDVEDGANLTYSVNPGGQATSGVASCTGAGVCTYAPNLNFFGSDSFIVRGTDSNGGFSTATVAITVTPVNDGPIANAQHVVVAEDAVNFPITVSGSDVDNVVLNFSAPIDDVDNGTINCLGASCTYSPDLNYNGPDSFTFTVDDGALSSTATVTIDVVAVNDAPVATDVPDAVADEDVPEPLTLTGTDVDTGDVVTVSAAADPANGTTSVDGPNLVTYQGDLNFHGIDTFDFTVTDSNGGFDDGTVTIVVNPVNDAPVAEDQSFSLEEDTPTFLSIAAGDVDGDLLTWSIDSGASNGAVFGSGPDVVYVPHFNFHGTDSFTIEVDDGNGGTDLAVITITVDPVNDQPVANATASVTDEDVAVVTTLTGSDVDGDSLSFTAPVLMPSNGTVSCSGPVCTYAPNPNFHGSDLYTFSVDDGAGGSDLASVSITVSSVNDAPVAVGTAVVTDEDTAVAVPLSATDVDGDALTFTYGSASSGTVSGSGPDAVYTPNPNTNGADSFGFTVDDGHGGTDSDTAAILVQAVNDAPVATGGSVTTPEDTPVDFQLGGSDVEGDPLTFAVTEPPETGTLTCDAAGACTFTPAADFNGTEVLAYEVSDGSLTSTGVFTILVDPDNDAPVAADGTAAVAEDSSVGITLSATDTESDPLTYTVTTPAANGNVVCSTDGSCTYTPAPNYAGPDSFVFTVDDGSTSDTGLVSITVVAVNDAPQALDVSAATNEDTPVSFFLLASDAEGDAITYSVDVPPAHGAVSISGNVATYTPATDYSGTDLFTYKATDPAGAFTTARASLVVNEVALIGTSLVGDAAVARVLVNLVGANIQGGLTLFPLMSATLRQAGGTPLAGRTISFTIGGNLVCTAVTNAQGVGQCSTEAAIASLLNLGYQVTFGGDADYAASTATGPIVQVLTLRLL